MMDRRRFCGGLMAAGLTGLLPARAGEPRIVTDMAGRQVTLTGVPRRIVLLEARDILGMALLHPDPAALVAGWAATDRIDSPYLQARFEQAHPIAVIGRQTPATISLEGVLGLSPDLVVASSYMLPASEGDGLAGWLARLGIPLVFSDVSSNGASQTDAGPIAHMRHYLRMWGEILDAGDRAAEFTAFADARLADVAQRLAGAAPVTTYLEVQSTMDDCCWAAGTQVWGELLALAGGQVLPGVSAPWFEKLQREYLMATPHEVYIASGGGWVSGGRPEIGPGIPAETGRQGLARLLTRPGFADLQSTRQRRVHGIWTGLITVPPFNLLFVETVARWLHPERMAGLEPERTFAEINRRFLAEPIAGPLWVSLQE